MLNYQSMKRQQVTFSIYLDPDLYEQLRLWAFERHMPMAEVIRQAVTKLITKQEQHEN